VLRLPSLLVVQFLAAEHLAGEREDDFEVAVREARQAQHADGAFGRCGQGGA
jgi:hypothetical protein